MLRYLGGIFPYYRFIYNYIRSQKLGSANLKICFRVGWATEALAHLISRFACNTRVIVDASSNPPVSHVKSL